MKDELIRRADSKPGDRLRNCLGGEPRAQGQTEQIHQDWEPNVTTNVHAIVGFIAVDYIALPARPWGTDAAASSLPAQ